MITAISAEACRSLRIYNLFFPIAFLLLLPGFLLRMFRRGGHQEKFGQRLARFAEADLARLRSREWLWIHSISVGETFVALKLARALHAIDPKVGMVLSVTTSTGFAEARKAASDWLEVIYNPLDLPSIVRRTLRVVRPRHLVFIEAMWPNLLAEAVRAGVPTSIVPRVSPRSERRYRRFRALTGPLFRLFDQIFVSESLDIDRWKSLGVDRVHVICTGSIKFDQAGSKLTRQEEFRALLQSLGVPLSAPIVVAGSTWAPEEMALARVLPELRREHPGLFLILVPRHVERANDILQQLAPLNLRIARRTQPPAAGGSPPDILLVDVTGELREWYGLATVVFIGKSLPGVAEVGGQNPAEPAMLERPVIFGPHMENFAVLTSQLLQAEAVTQVENAETLPFALSTLLSDPGLRTAKAGRAKAALEAHVGATARTAHLILNAIRSGLCPWQNTRHDRC